MFLYPKEKIKEQKQGWREKLTSKIVCLVIFITECTTAKTEKSQRNQLFIHQISGFPHACLQCTYNCNCGINYNSCLCSFFTQGRFSPLLPLSCIFLMLAGRYSGEAIKHKKHQKNKSEFSGSFKIISTSHLLETKIRGLKKKKPQTVVLKWYIIQKKLFCGNWKPLGKTSSHRFCCCV